MVVLIEAMRFQPASVCGAVNMCAGYKRVNDCDYMYKDLRRNMDASIVILTKNAGHGLKGLLERLFCQQFSGSFEALIVDSGSTDGSLETARTFPVAIVEIEPGEFHHGKTRNLGAELSQGDVLVYITQDAMPCNDDWLEKLTGNLHDPDVGMVIGRQIPWESAKPPEKFSYIYNFPNHSLTILPGQTNYYRDNVFISNVNSAIRRNVWEQLRFSETILMAEDKEFAKRVLAGGWSIAYDPEAAVHHSHDFSLWSAFQRSLDYGISLRQGAAGLPRSNASIGRKIVQCAAAELGYLNATRSLKWLPYSLLYEAGKYLGMFLGRVGVGAAQARSERLRS